MYVAVHRSSSQRRYAVKPREMPERRVPAEPQGSTAAELELEERKALSLQDHLQQVKDPAALVMLRRLKDRIGQMRSSLGRQ